MRLKVIHSRSPRHTDSVTAVEWVNSEEIISLGDDRQILKWKTSTMEASPLNHLAEASFPTSMHWFPRTVKGQSDIYSMTTTDGKLHIVNKNMKSEKSVEAHKGAAISARWSPDGSGLLTCGEDGAVKMWSRSCMLRSVIAQFSSPVHCISWDNSSTRILYCNNDSCFIKSLKQQTNALKWKAHDGIVMCCDWSPQADVIVTGAEDLKFKVWDTFGRILFSSAPYDYAISSIRWSPDGTLFTVGSYNMIRLCDKAGWSHSLEKLGTGSILEMAWSPDGTQLAAATAGGHVIHAHLTEKRLSYRNLEIVQTKPNMIEVRDVSSDTAKEKLETRDRITRISIKYDYVMIITITQLYIFSSSNWNTPVITDLKDRTPSIVIQCEKIFLLGDGVFFYILNYDGRTICEIKAPGATGPSLNEMTTALANDTIVFRDRGDIKTLHFFDPSTSKPQGDGALTHENDIMEVAISQTGPLSERTVAFRDQNSNIHLALVKTYRLSQRIAKIGSLVEQLTFNDVSNILAGVADNRLVVWPAPGIVFTDRSLLPISVIEKSITGLGRFPYFLSFSFNSALLRRSDGSLLPVIISPFPAALLTHISNNKWDQSIRLCRQVNDNVLWAILAGLAVQEKNLFAAEIAYGSLDQADKVTFLAEARNCPNKDIRNAMLIELSGKIADADILLEKTGNIFQSIMLNVKMFRWDRAIDMAIAHRKYLEIVMGYRQRYLKEMKRNETDPKYLKYSSEVEIDFEHIRELISAETKK
ncbi:unnamed protein product [Auanema sp. JU1783]|nr:unnamed protein product [Auanema sp. JU1783]